MDSISRTVPEVGFAATASPLSVRVKIALAFELSRIPTTDPQPHDVLMDFVVTENGILAVTAAGLVPLAPERCREQVAAIAADRGLPRPVGPGPPPPPT